MAVRQFRPRDRQGRRSPVRGRLDYPVKRRAAAGRLHSIHRGVYAVGHPHLSAGHPPSKSGAPAGKPRSLASGLTTRAKDDATRSELEFLFLRLCRRYRLPTPEVNAWINGVLVDFAWRNRRLIVETDGYRYHRGRVSFENERVRDLRLRSDGFEVVRLTFDQVARRPGETADALRRLLARAASR